MKKVLLLGSFKSFPTRSKLMALQSIITALVDAGYKIMNGNGQYLGQIVYAIILQIAKTKDISPSDICEQFVPLQREIMEKMGVVDDQFNSLAAYHRKCMVDSSPDAFLFIEGGTNTHNEWQMASDEVSRLRWLGLPQFGGTGSQIYEFYKARFLNDARLDLYTAIGAEESYHLQNTKEAGAPIVAMLNAMTE
ncbi:hypothetical protein KBC03_05920 [Patescibacteria group bacterium]|nr:hypothetical protein [Patescibacteria group bacterium]